MNLCIHIFLLSNCFINLGTLINTTPRKKWLSDLCNEPVNESNNSLPNHQSIKGEREGEEEEEEADEQPESPIYSDRKRMNNLNHPFIQTSDVNCRFGSVSVF